MPALTVNPFRFRPPETTDTDPVDWSDNRISNAMAWVAHTYAPAWCQEDTHWTGRITAYLFTSCPCCMLFRGFVIGAAVTAVPFAILTIPLAIAIALWTR